MTVPAMYCERYLDFYEHEPRGTLKRLQLGQDIYDYCKMRTGYMVRLYVRFKYGQSGSFFRKPVRKTAGMDGVVQNEATVL